MTRATCSQRFTTGSRRALTRWIFRKRKHCYKRWKAEQHSSQRRVRCKMDQGDRSANEPNQSRREGRGDEDIDAHPGPLAGVFSGRGHRIRLTLRQWVHIMENHDYMAGNRELVLKTLADPDELVEG